MTAPRSALATLTDRPAAAHALDVDVAAGFVAQQQVGGAEFMLYNLVDGLRQATTGRVTVPHRDGRPLGRHTPGCAYRPVRAGNRFVADLAVGARAAGDVVLFPNYFTPPARRSTSVTVIHDVQYRYFPQHFSSRKRRWLAAAQAYTVRSADVVIAISHAVREDLLRLYGADAQRVQVVSNPIDFARFDAAADGGPSVAAGALVAVAAHWPHKNIETLVAGYARYRATGGRLRLTLIGSPRSALVGKREWTDVSLDGQIEGLDHLGHVDDATLGAHLRMATAFLHPSLFEGFGMPVAEALGLGVPTVCAPLPALVEVAGDMANYCPQAEDPDAWASWMHRAEFGDLRRPGADEVMAVRHRFAPATVGLQYLDAVTGAA
jgi:glycosyltransferase involved in cell wall biosynthesis